VCSTTGGIPLPSTPVIFKMQVNLKDEWMLNMNYFKTLGIIFGLIAFLKPLYMHILPWDENRFLEKAYTEKRPSWIVPVAITGLLLVCFTWYMELTTDIPYSMVITVMFSLTAVKGLILLFDYRKFYQWVAGMLSKDKGRKIILVDILAGIFGLIMIVFSLLFL